MTIHVNGDQIQAVIKVASAREALEAMSQLLPSATQLLKDNSAYFFECKFDFGNIVLDEIALGGALRGTDNIESLLSNIVDALIVCEKELVLTPGLYRNEMTPTGLDLISAYLISSFQYNETLDHACYAQFRRLAVVLDWYKVGYANIWKNNPVLVEQYGFDPEALGDMCFYCRKELPDEHIKECPYCLKDLQCGCKFCVAS